jgi:phosphoserine phosphatase
LSTSNKTTKHLAVFDVEGIILPKRQFLLLQATTTLKLSKIVLVLLQGFLYELGIYPLASAFRGIYGLFKGILQREMYQTFNLIPIIPGVRLVFQKLKEMGYQMEFSPEKSVEM